MDPSQIPTQIALPWGEVIKLAIGAGVVTAVVNHSIGWFRDWQKEQGTLEKDARYLAIRLAVILEQYAYQCADLIADNDMYSSSEGHAGQYHGSLPDLPGYPEEVDWKSLDPNLAARALTFRNELPLSDKTIAFWADVDRECISNACDEEAGKCGYRAWEIAKDLRREYKLPTFEHKQVSYDFVKTLKEHHDRVTDRLKETHSKQS